MLICIWSHISWKWGSFMFFGIWCRPSE